MTKKRRLNKEAKETQELQEEVITETTVEEKVTESEKNASATEVEDDKEEVEPELTGKTDDKATKDEGSESGSEQIGTMVEKSTSDATDTEEELSWEEDMIVDIRECIKEITTNDESDWGSYSKIILSTISRMTVLAASQYLGKKGQTLQKEELQKAKKIDWKSEKMKFVLNAFKTKVEGEQSTTKEIKNWEKEFKNFSGKKNMEQIVAQVFHKRTGISLDEIAAKLPTTNINGFPYYNSENHKWGTVKCDAGDEAIKQDIKNQIRLVCGPATLVTLHTIFGVFTNKEDLKYRLKDLQVMQQILVTMGEHGANAPTQWEHICGMMMQNWNMLVAVEHHPGMLNRTQVYQWVHSILILIHDHFPRDTYTEHKLSKILGIAMLANHRNEELLRAIHELLPNFLTLPDHIGHNMVINRHDPTQVESNAYQNWKNQQVAKKVSVLYNELEMAKDIWPIQAWVKDTNDIPTNQAEYGYQKPGNFYQNKKFHKNRW